MLSADILPLGAEWSGSSIWGKPAGHGRWVEQVSPLHKTVIQRIPLIDQTEAMALLNTAPDFEVLNAESLHRFCARLYEALNALYPSLLETTQLETAFNARDCAEMVQTCIEYVRGFTDYFTGLPHLQPVSCSYPAACGTRHIQQLAIPWGTIAAILPQSAFLYLAITCLLNALATGNRIIIRAPLQSARSAGLLGLAIESAQPPEGSISIVMISARAFIQEICNSDQSILVHYLGSSAHAPELLSDCFKAGKHVLIDGEGNTWMWVDEDVSVDYACDVLTAGALRYNGQTCTSINGAILHPVIYRQLKERLTHRWAGISAGNPLDADVTIGPLLDEAQAEHCLVMVRESGATVLAGGERDGSLLTPTLVAEPKEDSTLMCKGLFGPVLWIAPGDVAHFSALWPRNCYPLCAGTLTATQANAQRLLGLPKLARLVLNGDPSEEYLYEPWGGYPATGNNPVGHWYRKYLRPMQIDSPASFVSW